jgi:hypothetical protein
MFPSALCTQAPSIFLKLGIKILVPNVYIPVRHGLWIFCCWIMTIHHHVTGQISTATTTGSVPLFTNMNWTWSMIPGYRFRMFLSAQRVVRIRCEKKHIFRHFTRAVCHCEVNQTWCLRHSQFHFCGLFHEAGSVSDYTASNARMIGE